MMNIFTLETLYYWLSDLITFQYFEQSPKYKYFSCQNIILKILFGFWETSK